jgi:hypothetical protein
MNHTRKQSNHGTGGLKMDEYIERDRIYSRVKTETNPYGKPTIDYESGVKVLDMIKQEPAADVAPVVHGEWKLHDNGDGTCNQCHFRQKLIWDYDNWQNYCGVCGARMDGGKHE